LGEIDVMVATGCPIVIETRFGASVTLPALTVMLPVRVELTVGLSKADWANVIATFVPQEYATALVAPNVIQDGVALTEKYTGSPEDFTVRTPVGGVVPGVQLALGDIASVAVTVGVAFVTVMLTVTLMGARPALSISTRAEYVPAGLLAATRLGLNVSVTGAAVVHVPFVLST
jgi:hypothetical protein